MPEDLLFPEKSIIDKTEELVEDVVEGTGKRVVKWIKGFITQLGKNLAMILFWLAAFFLSEGLIDPNNFTLFIITVIVIIGGLFILGILLLYFNKIRQIEKNTEEQSKVAETDKKAFAETQMAIVKMFTTSEKKLQKRITGIEELTDDIQIDWDFETGQIIHINKPFIEKFGFDLNHIRAATNSNDIASVMKYITETIVHPEDQRKVFDINERRISGETIDSYKVYLLDKHGDKFYALIKAGKIQNNGNTLFQFLIKDIQDEKDMKETILAQESELENYKKSFIRKNVDEQTAIDLLNYLEGEGL